jgi:hypothetical protein
MEEKWNAYKILVQKPEEKKPVTRTKRSWEDNKKFILRK